MNKNLFLFPLVIVLCGCEFQITQQTIFISYNSNQVSYKFNDKFFIIKDKKSSYKIQIPDSWGDKETEKRIYYTDNKLKDIEFNVEATISEYHVKSSNKENLVFYKFISLEYVNPIFKEFDICLSNDNKTLFSVISEESKFFFIYHINDVDFSNNKLEIEESIYKKIASNSYNKILLTLEGLLHYNDSVDCISLKTLELEM